ncbi:33374_t:CDS:2, partial [Racocetra persica]
MTLREINSRQSLIREYDQTAPKLRLSRVELIATRKIIGYILIYLIQWTPVLIYVVGETVHYNTLWINVIAIATINFGGIGNMTTYMINERQSDDCKSSIICESSSRTPNFTPTINVTDDESQITINEVVTIEVNQYHFSSSPIERVFGI